MCVKMFAKKLKFLKSKRNNQTNDTNLDFLFSK